MTDYDDGLVIKDGTIFRTWANYTRKPKRPIRGTRVLSKYGVLEYDGSGWQRLYVTFKDVAVKSMGRIYEQKDGRWVESGF